MQIVRYTRGDGVTTSIRKEEEVIEIMRTTVDKVAEAADWEQRWQTTLTDSKGQAAAGSSRVTSLGSHSCRGQQGRAQPTTR